MEIVKQFFKEDNLFQLLKVELLSVDSNKAEIGLKVEPMHLNGNGVLHGATFFALADAAFGALANFLHPKTVTQAAQINYIAPGTADYVIATAVELVRRGRNCIYQVVIKSREGEIFCTATMNGFITS